MNLIIKDKIPMFKRGYPTVSDKYNVAGGTLAGATPVNFGDLVKISGTKGYFENAAGAANLQAIGGFVVATNVKLAENWPGTTVQVNPGEAFNLLIDGFIAIELDAAATEGQIIANAPVEVILATGKCTTSDKHNAGTIDTLPNVVFTGLYEKHGAAIYAEIYVK